MKTDRPQRPGLPHSTSDSSEVQETPVDPPNPQTRLPPEVSKPQTADQLEGTRGAAYRDLALRSFTERSEAPAPQGEAPHQVRLRALQGDSAAPWIDLTVRFQDVPTDPELEQRIGAVVDRVMGLWPGGSADRSIEVVVGDGVEAGCAGAIYLPAKPKLEGGDRVSPELVASCTETTLAHELGHLLLASALEEVSPLVRDFYETRDLTLFKKREMFALIKQGMANGIMEGGAAETEAEIVAVQEEMFRVDGALEEIVDRLPLERDALQALEELFADLVAVLHADDPEAMFDNARLHPDDRQKERAKYRSFSHTWDLTSAEWSVYDYHDMLAPARSHIGRELLSRFSPEQTLEIALAAVERIVADPPTPKDAWTPGRFNVDLMREIDEQVVDR